MANYPAAKKAIRRDEKRTKRNRHVKSTFRTGIKALRAELGKQAPKKEELVAKLKEVQTLLMKSASKGVLPKSRASRYVSRLSKAVAAKVK